MVAVTTVVKFDRADERTLLDDWFASVSFDVESEGIPPLDPEEDDENDENIVAAGGMGPNTLVFKFDPSQPRDPHTGEWIDTTPGDLIKSSKKVIPAIIYKKHGDGAIVGQSSIGDKRMRWDEGRKKFIIERDKNGEWTEESALTKSAAYNDMKESDKWFEPGQTGTKVGPSTPPQKSEPAPSPIEPTAETTPKPSKTTTTGVVSPEEAKKLLDEVKGDDNRADYMRAALKGYDNFGDKASVYVARDKNGKLTGAMAIVDHDDPEELDLGDGVKLTPYSLVDYVGAVADTSAGTELVKQARQHANKRNQPLYVEPTSDSLGFWKKMGAVEDPLDEGAAYYGFKPDTSKVTLLSGNDAYASIPLSDANFNDDERDAVDSYVISTGYEDINTALRGSNGNTSALTTVMDDGVPVRDRVTQLDDLLAKSELKTSVQLNRFVDLENIFGDGAQTNLTGKSFIDHAFISTTTLTPDQFSTAHDYEDELDGVPMLNITAEPGVHAIAIGEVQGDNEVLLERGLTFEITNDRKINGRRVLDVTVKPSTLLSSTESEAPASTGAFNENYTGPVVDYDGVSPEIIDKVRQAWLASTRYEARVNARATELRATGKYDDLKFGAWQKSMDDARAELAADKPSDDVLDQAIDLLTKELPGIENYDARDAIRRRLHLEAVIETKLDAFAKKNGLGEVTPALKADLAKRVKDAFADKKIAIRVTPKSLEHILDDKRFKSQFESGKSKGKNDPQARTSIERQLFGIKDKTWQNVEKRPIYGYVAMDGVRPVGIGSNQVGDPSTDQLSQYGQIQVVLKDSVRDRTTAMFGDSMNNMYEGLPSSVNQPSWFSYLATSGGLTSHGLTGLDRSGTSSEFRAGSYAEAQIHGGVTINDIEEIVLPNAPSAALKKQLNDAGVSWRVLNFKTAASGSDEERKNALRIARQDKVAIEAAIAELDAKIADTKYVGDYTKDRDKYVKQLKTINDALPKLEAGVKSTTPKKIS